MPDEKKEEAVPKLPHMPRSWEKYHDFLGQQITVVMDIRTAAGYMQFVGRLEEETEHHLVMTRFKGPSRDNIPKGYIVKDRIAAIYLSE